MDFIIPIITMSALGLILSIGLAFAYRKLRVKEDPTAEKIAELLPQANCGACGYSGCRAFAEALVKGEANPDKCSVGGEETANKISNILGVEAGGIIKKVARVHCRGSIKVTEKRGIYTGITTCHAAHLVGGNKQCFFGCLGFGDCVKACPFDAIYMSKEGLPVVKEDKCTGCGKCVDACPRNILELHPIDQEILVFCRSNDRGPTARKVCKNACIGCGICVRACPEAIVLENYLAKIIDYKKISPDKIPLIEKCPTNSIGRIHNKNEE